MGADENVGFGILTWVSAVSNTGHLQEATSREQNINADKCN
jgi:hypothetical protein